MIATWHPESEEDKAIKKAFQALDNSEDHFFLGHKSSAEKLIIQSKGYYDIRAYCLSGATLPSTDEEFNEKIPEAAWKHLNEIEPDIQDRTRKCMVGVADSCIQFRDTELHNIVDAGNEALSYSERAIKSLSVSNGTNLKDNLAVILDPKYQDNSSQDRAYHDALNKIKLTLERLQRDAEKRKTEVARIRNVLINFRDKTYILYPEVRYITKQFKTGPAENDKGETTPYLEVLDDKLAKLIEKIDQQVKDKDKAHDDRTYYASVAVGSLWWGPLGYIAVGSWNTAFAEQARKLYEELGPLIKSNTEEKQNIINLVTTVNLMVDQSVDLQTKMGSAITALGEVANCFNEQARCFGDIITAMQLMETDAKITDLSARKEFLEESVDETIHKLQRLGLAAKEFTDTILLDKQMH